MRRIRRYREFASICLALSLFLFLLPFANAEFFKIKASSLTGDNTGNISGYDNITNSGYGGTLRSADLISRGPVVDVRAYGAVGDNSTDDAAAIQAAIDALPAGGGSLFFPAGRYKIKTALTLSGKDSFKIYGAGTKFATDIVWDGAANGKIIAIDNSSYWEIADLNLIGNSNCDYGIYMAGASQLSGWTLKGLTISGCQQAGVRLGAYSVDSNDTDIGVGTIERCLIYDNKYNIWSDSMGTSTTTLLSTNLSWGGGATTSTNHIYAQRMGPMKMIGGYIGITKDTFPAINLLEGSIDFVSVDFEISNAGTAYIFQNAAQSASVIQRASSFYGCSFYAMVGMVLAANAPPVSVSESTFFKDAAVGSWNTAWITIGDNTAYRSIGNTYYQLSSVAGVHPFSTYDSQLSSVISIGDRYNDDNTAVFKPLSDLYGRSYVQVAAAASPFTVPRDTKFILANTTTDNITLNLPTAASTPGTALTIANQTANYYALIVPSGSDKIGGTAATRTLKKRAGESISLKSNGYDDWVITSLSPHSNMSWGATESVADNTAITHNMGETPTAVICTASVATETCQVTAIAATTFTVRLTKHDGTAGTSQTVYWQAMK